MSATQIRDEAFYDLAEVSAVPVPADPDALKQTLSASASVVDLFDDQRVTAETLVRTLMRRALSELAKRTPEPEPEPAYLPAPWPAGFCPPHIWRITPRNRWP
jgi:hypothetical protein